MNTSGEAAEQVMRMSLEGAEILIKLTGSGAKNAAVLLYSIYKEQNKTRGKERLTNMLRSGKPLKVYTFKRDNLEKFKEVAKEYLPALQRKMIRLRWSTTFPTSCSGLSVQSV